MKNRIIVTLILLAVLVGCGKPSIPDDNGKTEVTTGDKAKNFVEYREKITKILQDNGGDLFSTDCYGEFSIELSSNEETYLYIGLSKEYAFLQCGYSFNGVQTIPNEMSVEFLADLLAAIDQGHNYQLSQVKNLEHFFLAADTEYFPDDYDEMKSDANYWGYELLSYKELGDYDSEYYSYMTAYDDLSGSFGFQSNRQTTEEDLFLQAEAIKKVLDNSKSSDWVYTWTENYEGKLSIYSEVNITISSPEQKEILLDLSEVVVDFSFYNELVKLEDEFKVINTKVFIELMNLLAPGTLSEKELVDFLNSKENQMLYPMDEFTLKEKLWELKDGRGGVLYYRLDDDLISILDYTTLSLKDVMGTMDDDDWVGD
jgi:hypothetical protein